MLNEDEIGVDRLRYVLYSNTQIFQQYSLTFIQFL